MANLTLKAVKIHTDVGVQSVTVNVLALNHRKTCLWRPINLVFDLVFGNVFSDICSLYNKKDLFTHNHKNLFCIVINTVAFINGMQVDVAGGWRKTVGYTILTTVSTCGTALFEHDLHLHNLHLRLVTQTHAQQRNLAKRLPTLQSKLLTLLTLKSKHNHLLHNHLLRAVLQITMYIF